MCRWLAYSGSPIPMDALLYRPKHSLIDQSQHAELGETRPHGIPGLQAPKTDRQCADPNHLQGNTVAGRHRIHDFKRL